MHIRAAEPEDREFAAEMIYDTMGPLADALIGLGSHERTMKMLGEYFIRPENQFTYKWAEILEEEGRPAAFLLSMPGKELNRLVAPMARLTLKLYGPMGFLRVMWLSLSLAFETEAEDDEYYISNLAVHRDFRRRGFAEILLRRAEESARRFGLDKCSLLVEMGNAKARPLYLKMGYEVAGISSNWMMRRLLATPGSERMIKKLDQR